MDLLRIAARVAADDEAGDYDAWVEKIIADHAGQGVYIRFDEGPFSAQRSFTDENPNDHSNHLGIWAYLTEGARPTPHDFGWGSPYVTVLKAAGTVLRTDEYGEANLASDLKKLESMHGSEKTQEWGGFADRTKKEMRDVLEEDLKTPGYEMDPDLLEDMRASLSDESTTPFDKLDGAASAFAKGQSNRRDKLSQLYRDLGYSVIEDPLGSIDTAGNTALGLSPASMTVVKRYVRE
jgi:hypothetical protein